MWRCPSCRCWHHADNLGCSCGRTRTDDDMDDVGDTGTEEDFWPSDSLMDACEVMRRLGRTGVNTVRRKGLP